MSIAVNKTAIGAFVLGAIAIFVAGVLVLGAGKIFTKELKFITYFDGSVKGLNLGAPVTFNGVKIGEVTEISIVVDPATKKLKIPVIFTLEPEKFKGTLVAKEQNVKLIEKAVIEMGLRTQLQSMSFVTGQLMVTILFAPEKPPVFVGINKKYSEIPSISTPLEELQKTLENLPFEEIVENLNLAIKNVNILVSSIDAKQAQQSIEGAVKDVQKLVRHIDARIDPLVDSITKTSGAAESALVETRETMTATRREMHEFVATAKTTLEAAQAALKQSELTLQAYSGDSRFLTELDNTLKNLSATTRSLRNLSDYLERHPESVIRGKAAP